jgi:hypothetical protein
VTARGASAVIAIAALACACSRDSDHPHSRDITLGQRAMPELGPGVNTQTEARDAAAYTLAELLDAAARPGWTSRSDTTPQQTAPVAVATPTAAATATTAAAPKTNPDDPVLEQTRVACGHCFASLPAGAGYGPPTRSAHVSVVVISTGSVSRAEVTSDDTTDTDVLACIQRTAQGARFSDNSGGPLRTYAIDVQVAAPGANGGR